MNHIGKYFQFERTNIKKSDLQVGIIALNYEELYAPTSVSDATHAIVVRSSGDSLLISMHGIAMVAESDELPVVRKRADRLYHFATIL